MIDQARIIEHIPLERGVSIIEVHSEGVVALEKPFGVLSHPNSKEKRSKSLLTCHWNRQREGYQWKRGDDTYRFDLLHRLDSPTSGVILGCVNPSMTEILKKEFSRRRVAKTYLAIVAGLSRENKYHWKDFMRRKRMGDGLRAEICREGGRLAEAKVETIGKKYSSPQMSLLKLRPLTGRTHQLRVQCAQRKLPIVGDRTYGDFHFNRRIRRHVKPVRLFLHASSIRMRWNWKGVEQHFQARSPTPQEFDALMRYRSGERLRSKA